MSEADRLESADLPAESPTDSPCDPNALIASLHTQGAHRFDPVRWHYLQALATRAAAHQGTVRRMLDAKLAHALASFKRRLDRAQAEAGETVARSARRYPHATADLQQLHAAGDFKTLRRTVDTLEANESRASLGALVRRLEQQAPKNPDGRSGDNAVSHSELKTLSKFRNTWAKLSVDKQVAKALEQAPKNAGPINSHMLVLRSLELMRAISPDYLNRFMSYAEALLWLDQGEKDKPVPAKKPQSSKASKAAKK